MDNALERKREKGATIEPRQPARSKMRVKERLGRRERCDNANKDRWKSQGEIGVWTVGGKVWVASGKVSVEKD